MTTAMDELIELIESERLAAGEETGPEEKASMRRFLVLLDLVNADHGEAKFVSRVIEWYCEADRAAPRAPGC